MTWETETFTVPELEKILAGKKKKYIRYEEGITLYSMGKIPLRELAQDAHALIYLKRVAVINTEILDEYIERDTRCWNAAALSRQGGSTRTIFRQSTIFPPRMPSLPSAQPSAT